MDQKVVSQERFDCLSGATITSLIDPFSCECSMIDLQHKVKACSWSRKRKNLRLKKVDKVDRVAQEHF